MHGTRGRRRGRRPPGGTCACGYAHRLQAEACPLPCACNHVGVTCTHLHSQLFLQHSTIERTPGGRDRCGGQHALWPAQNRRTVDQADCQHPPLPSPPPIQAHDRPAPLAWQAPPAHRTASSHAVLPPVIPRTSLICKPQTPTDEDARHGGSGGTWALRRVCGLEHDNDGAVPRRQCSEHTHPG